MPSKRTLKTREGIELPLFDRAALALLFVLILSEVLSGPIRYCAVQLHLVWLPYLPRFLAVLVLGPMFIGRLVSEGVTSTYLALIVLFSVAATYGLFNLGNADQVEFGLWTLVTFMYGVLVCASLVRGWKKLTPYVVFLWALAVAGVLVNYFYRWPWAGLDYQVGATTVNAGRGWHTAGFVIPRLTGFARAWFEAALQILFPALFLKEVLPMRRWLPIWIVSGVAIALTTTKTTVAAYLLFSALWIFSRGKISTLWRTLPIALACLDVLLPFSMSFVSQNRLGEDQSPAAHLLIATLLARMQEEWPEAIKMIVTHGNPILGRGMGGIGTAQIFFEPALANAGENIALYLYGVFGILGLIFLIVYGWKASWVPTAGPVGRFLFYCACAVLVEGTTMSVLDASVFLPLAFGASLWYVQKATVSHYSHALAGAKRGIGSLRPGASRPERP
jgi:hypothetical protein